MKYLNLVKKMVPKLILPLLLLFIWTGCASDMTSKFNAPKNAFGQANRLCVIADQEELRAYLIVGDLSNPESPTVQSITKDLGAENLRKAHEQSDFNIKVGYDKWAQGQTLVYLFAQSQAKLQDAAERNFPAIANKLHKTDKEQFEATLYFGGESEAVKQKVKNQFEMDLRFYGWPFFELPDSQ